ncbi:MAG: hypothetical protein WBA17_07355 [Saprospiraceae bacterium]
MTPNESIALYLRDLHARLAPLRGERLRLDALLERNQAEIDHIDEQLTQTEKPEHRQLLTRKQKRLEEVNATYEQLRSNLQRLINSTDTLVMKRRATLMRLAIGNPDPEAACRALQTAINKDDTGFDRQWQKLSKRLQKVVL